MAANVSVSREGLKKIQAAAERAAVKTMEELYHAVVGAQVMPYETGTMQNASTFVSEPIVENGVISVLLTTDAPQARRLYYHPEYNFRTAASPNAQGNWLEKWVGGDKKDFVQNTFEKLMKKELG